MSDRASTITDMKGNTEMTEQQAEQTARRQYNRWTDEEVEKLRRFANLGVSTLSTILGRSKPNIYQKARQLGIEVRRTQTAGDDV